MLRRGGICLTNHPYHVAPKADFEKLDGLALVGSKIFVVHELVLVGGDFVGAMLKGNLFEAEPTWLSAIPGYLQFCEQHELVAAILTGEF